MYTTNRYWLKYGNEDDQVLCTFKEWKTLKEALRYLRRYQNGTRYVSCGIMNEDYQVVYEDIAGRGEILYDAAGNIVDCDDLIDTAPAENGIKEFAETASHLEDSEEVLAVMGDVKRFIDYSPIKTAIMRILEKRYRELLRKEVSDNGSPFKIDNELDKVLKEWSDRIKRKEAK